jgi:hypothetical protein
LDEDRTAYFTAELPKIGRQLLRMVTSAEDGDFEYVDVLRIEAGISTSELIYMDLDR